MQEQGIILPVPIFPGLYLVVYRMYRVHSWPCIQCMHFASDRGEHFFTVSYLQEVVFLVLALVNIVSWKTRLHINQSMGTLLPTGTHDNIPCLSTLPSAHC